MKDLKYLTIHKEEAGSSDAGLNKVSRRARIQGSSTFVSLNSRLESNKEEEGA